MGLPPDLRRASAWEPGLVGGIAALHARQYAESHGFGPAFEAKVAHDLGGFLARLDPARGDHFAALLDAATGEARASVALDATEPGLPDGVGHLRWFILSPALRGRGLGRALLGGALDAARAAGLHRVFLWTLDGLPAAAHLYGQAGFAETERLDAGSQWGRPTVELRMDLALRGAAARERPLAAGPGPCPQPGDDSRRAKPSTRDATAR